MQQPKTPRSKTKAYARKYDQLRRDHGYHALVDGTVTRRKLEALQAIGYSLTNLGQRIGRTQQSLSETFHGDEPIHWTTERAIARLYDELHHSPPEGIYANRVRIRARRLGYAPPASYDDINCKHERPKGVVKT
jgi:hypothetical protein